jgi:hypothetical protein
MLQRNVRMAATGRATKLPIRFAAASILALAGCNRAAPLTYGPPLTAAYQPEPPATSEADELTITIAPAPRTSSASAPMCRRVSGSYCGNGLLRSNDAKGFVRRRN